MFEKIAEQTSQVIVSMQDNMLFALKIVSILWAVQILNALTKYSLNRFGIQPRQAGGLVGVVVSPLLHGDFNHLFFNTIPMFVLSDLVLLDGKTNFYYVTAMIVVFSGLLTWMLGRRAIHIGASGVIMGYFGYLLAKAYFQLTGVSIILAGLCLYYFGGLITSVFPSAKKNISWEGHIFGLVSGVFVAYYFNNIMNWLGVVAS